MWTSALPRNVIYSASEVSLNWIWHSDLLWWIVCFWHNDPVKRLFLRMWLIKQDIFVRPAEGSNVETYARWATGWTAGFRFPTAQDFSIPHSVQTVLGPHPASYPVGTGGSFLGGKAARREADHSPPSVAEFNDVGAIPPLPHMSSWRSA
jgi:hypothetical protein